MSVLTTEVQSIWRMFEDYFKGEIEEITSNDATESIFQNVTQSLTSIPLGNYIQQDNTSDYINVPSKELYNTTVYATYPSEVIWFGAITCIIFSILGTTGNLISILALINCRRLRNATTTFIVNLCVADLLYCCFTMPLTAVTFIDRDWKNGDALCKLFSLVKFSNGIVSIFTVVAITINRYVLIVHPKVYRIAYSKRNLMIHIGCLWALPLILISLPLFNVWGTLIYNPKVGDCGVNNLNGKSPRAFIFVLIIVLPSIIFIACYTKIYFVVKNSIGSNRGKQDEYEMGNCKRTSRADDEVQKKSSNPTGSARVELRDKKEFRVLRIVLVIFIFYTLSIFPISLIKLFRQEGKRPFLNVLGYIFYFSASVINPVIYIVMSREYRMAYQELFTSKKLGCI